MTFLWLTIQWATELQLYQVMFHTKVVQGPTKQTYYSTMSTRLINSMRACQGKTNIFFPNKKEKSNILELDAKLRCYFTIKVIQSVWITIWFWSKSVRKIHFQSRWALFSAIAVELLIRIRNYLTSVVFMQSTAMALVSREVNRNDINLVELHADAFENHKLHTRQRCQSQSILSNADPSICMRVCVCVLVRASERLPVWAPQRSHGAAH